jgi:predicted lipoprotein with Yx(FWY)xxD motif
MRRTTMGRTLRRLSILVTLAGMAVAGLVTAGAAPALAASGTEITTADTPFGTALVVGSGTYKGYSLYDITSDNAPFSYGCTTTVLHLGGQALTCTGPEGDPTAVWPALTTTGPPAAGPGVNPALLGTVHRAGVGTQVTYAGHPLYLFDDAPNQVNGEGFQDPASPLPHGTWFLVKPNGNQLPWTPTLTTVTIGGHKDLAVRMVTLAGWISFPAYTRAAPCPPGLCARVWPYVLTAGFPGTSGGVRHSRIGLIRTGLGVQVTYRGQPLYLYSQEQVNLTTFLAAGNGNGVAGFSLVSP